MEYVMCRQVTCKKCGGTTWAGCGQHVKQVMAGVPASKQCTCSTATGKTEEKFTKSLTSGWLSKIFGS
jgi:hypothetical protein